MLAEEEEIEVVEHKFNNEQLKGLYVDNVITLNSHMQTIAEKKCVLAEELGHYYTTHGDILDQTNIKNIKQENLARAWSYKNLIPIYSFVEAYQAGTRNRYEMAEFLEVTEEYLNEALQYYKSKHGLYYFTNNYLVYFDPFAVVEKYWFIE